MKALPLVTLAGTLAFVRDAAVQATPPPAGAPGATSAAAGDSSGILMALALMGALLIIVGVGVKIWDVKRKREAEAVHLQSQISDALLREQEFFGLAITPTVTAGIRRSSPMQVVVSGQAPSDVIRDAALRIVDDEASRIGADYVVINRIEVRPDAVRRAA